jgi:hypothetical protein
MMWCGVPAASGYNIRPEDVMKKIIIIVAAFGVAFAIWRARHDGDGADARLLADRVWLDHPPRSDTDTINVFVALTRQPVGLFQASSAWRGAFELFRYEAHGDEVRMVFPQTGERVRARARARRCDERGMDYCLELDGAGRGVKRYYSRKGWEIRGGDVSQIAGRVAEVARSAPGEATGL